MHGPGNKMETAGASAWGARQFQEKRGEAYQRYQQLAVAKQIAQEQLETAQLNEESWDWGGWGWGPYGPQRWGQPEALPPGGASGKLPGQASGTELMRQYPTRGV